MKDDTISRAAAIEAVHKYWIAEVHKLPRKMVGEYEVLDGDYKTPTIHNKKICEAIEALPSAQTEQRWTPCCEQMPKEFGYYLCWYEYYHVSKNKVLPEYGIGYYDPEMEFWSGEVGQGRGAKVLAWTFLPEPWEGEENG